MFFEKNDQYYLSLAYEYAKKHSSDPRTKNGAIIVDPETNDIISYGANRFPNGVVQLEERLRPEVKRSYLEHAERDAIFSALRQGKSTVGKIMYVPWFACSDCAKAIIGAGIVCVIGHKTPCDRVGDWSESINIGLSLFREAKVAYKYYDGEIGIENFMFNGELVSR